MRSIRQWFQGQSSDRAPRRGSARRSRPTLESLESRVVLYSATGNAWLNPSTITISFMPDGTNLGGATSNLISSFDSKPALVGRWRDQILMAAQAWAQQTNINFVVVADDGAPSGSGDYQEGSPTHGDIRIGGYNFGNPALAEASQPPPINNFSIAGDITFNTAQSFNVGTTYDLFTVAMHEFGHALGLDHSSAAASVAMFPTYNGRKVSLAPDDIAGIRSIYSGSAPRSRDMFNVGGFSNSTLASAANLTNLLDPNTLTAVVPNLDISTAGQTEYFFVTAPWESSGTLNVTAQSAGLSLLAPRVTVIGVDGVSVLGSAVSGVLGSTLQVSVPNLQPGQSYFVKVQGATTGAAGTGRYALALSFNGAPAPVVATPLVAYSNGNPLSSGGGQAEMADDDMYVGAAPIIVAVTPDTGVSSNDGVTSSRRITLKGTSPSDVLVSIYRNATLVGTTRSGADGTWTFNDTGTSLADGTHAFTATVTDPSGHVSERSFPYRVTVDTQAPGTPVIRGMTPYLVTTPFGGITADASPTLFGTAAPFSTVTVTAGTRMLGSVAANANGDWNFVMPAQRIGMTILTANATDRAGNTSGSTSIYAVVIVSPIFASGQASSPVVTSAQLAASSVVGVNPNGSFTVDGTPTFTGTATANSLVAVLEDNVIIGVVLATSKGGWSFATRPLTDGPHRMSFQAFDQYGNSTASSSVIVIQVM